MHYRRSFSSFHRLVPAKLMRDWKALFVSGKPLYEQVPPPESTEPSPEQILEEERQALLDEGDFSEYKVKSLHHMHFRIMHKKHVGFKYACRSFDNKFFSFFQTMTGEWQPPEGSEVTQPPRDNPITGHVIQRLFNMVSPPTVSLHWFTTTRFWNINS